MEVDSTGYVQSVLASDNRYIGRFYVYPSITGGSGDADILVAYNDEEGGASIPDGAELFRISFDGANFDFATNGDSGTAAANPGWNLIEFDYTSGGDFIVWINGEWNHGTSMYDSAPTDTLTSSTGKVESVRLGAPAGLGGLIGAIHFDAYEAHRSTPVGALLACDAEGDAAEDIDINDALAVLDEVFGNPSIPAMGQPDCDLNGSVNINDALAILDIVF